MRRGELNTSLLRYCLLPFGMEVLRDLSWGVRRGSMEAILHSVPLRAVQKWARWQGVRAGMKNHATD